MYLDNTGSEIVIDAVLTDIGRQKLRQGNFNPVKFALSDDGIDYTLSQSDIQDMKILQAPVNSKQSMRFKLYTLVSDGSQIDTGNQETIIQK